MSLVSSVGGLYDLLAGLVSSFVVLLVGLLSSFFDEVLAVTVLAVLVGYFLSDWLERQRVSVIRLVVIVLVLLLFIFAGGLR